jgi:hypothetical protein
MSGGLPHHRHHRVVHHLARGLTVINLAQRPPQDTQLPIDVWSKDPLASQGVCETTVVEQQAPGFCERRHLAFSGAEPDGALDTLVR